MVDAKKQNPNEKQAKPAQNTPANQAVQPAQTPSEPSQEPVEGDELPPEEEEKLPFPTARVVRIIKENLKKPHQIRAEVKVAANNLLGGILTDIANSMDNEEVFTLSIDHFNAASRKYRTLDLQKKKIEKIKKLLDKQRSELEEAIMEMELMEEEFFNQASETK